QLLVQLERCKQSIAEMERSQAELRDTVAASRKTEEKYRSIFEEAIEGIFQTSLDGHFIAANPSLARIHGYDSPQDLIRSITAMSKQLYVHPEDRLAMIKKLDTQGFLTDFETQMYSKDGSIHWISMNIRAVRDEENHVRYYEGTMLDITERKQVEIQLRDSEERYRAAIENSNDGVAIVQENVHQYVNRRFVEMFEYSSPDEIIGESVLLIIHPDDVAKVGDINRRRSLGEPVPSRYEFKGVTKTGKILYVEVSAANIPLGNETGYLIYLRDVTKRKHAEEVLIQSRNALESLNRAKTKAVNHISHELRTPLSVIQGSLKLIKRKLEGIPEYSSIRGLMEPLDRNLQRLLSISRETDKIFRLSQELEAVMLVGDLDRLWQRMESLSEVPMDIREHWNALRDWVDNYFQTSTQFFQSIDLYTFIVSVVERMKNKLSGRELDIRVDGEHDLFISIDPGILRDIAEGLIKNAIENTPDGGMIRIGLEQKDDRIALAVTDSGIGITEENKRYLLDGLHHTKETDLYTSKQPLEFGAGGKGLDLLRMKYYALRFGFDITYDSNRCVYIPTDKDLCPGDISLCRSIRSKEECLNSGGSTFTVSFPVRKGPSSDDEP
ncbi:MAG: two component system sensor histidine kinase, + domain, partial [Deltaproteobacteria bacterium]|nr:two component system sensor histidine kinase, + domain [Deltaproteobacteria bacterium]